MKHTIYIVLGILLACVVSSCSGTYDIDEFIQEETAKRNAEQKQKEEEQKKQEYPTFSSPQWAQQVVSEYEHTMTVFAVLPDSLEANRSDDDEMAVLCGSVVRGSLTYTKLSSTQGVWMGMVYGNVNDALKIGYYGAKYSHLYYTPTTFALTSDGHYGTVDTPKKISLSVVTK